MAYRIGKVEGYRHAGGCPARGGGPIAQSVSLCVGSLQWKYTSIATKPDLEQHLAKKLPAPSFDDVELETAHA